MIPRLFQKKNHQVNYQKTGKTIVLGSHSGVLDERLCWEVLSQYPKKLILVGGKIEQLDG